MRCENCGHDNLPDARFCANCGAAPDALAAVRCH
ncbi:MAG TPA: zinc-ribbon domain-containing protein [Dehalococcoidia bacterium]|nr:zinc-ribbon domain-containing protein [Dehalococcoidia bacterium]